MAPCPPRARPVPDSGMGVLSRPRWPPSALWVCPPHAHTRTRTHTYVCGGVLGLSDLPGLSWSPPPCPRPCGASVLQPEAWGLRKAGSAPLFSDFEWPGSHGPCSQLLHLSEAAERASPAFKYPQPWWPGRRWPGRGAHTAGQCSLRQPGCPAHLGPDKTSSLLASVAAVAPAKIDMCPVLPCLRGTPSG